MTSVIVKDIGPVERVDIPIPEGGGLVVLRGRNGAGKTKTLDAVEALVSGRGKVEVRDGALKGSVDGFGATINVARSTRRSGELEVTTLEGRLSVADLVDPGLVSPEAADAARIKALVQLAGVEPDLSLFYELVGTQEEFERCTGNITPIAGDLVSTAAKIKRELESEARQEEGFAETVAARAKAKRDAIGGIDLNAPFDGVKLQDAYRDAIKKQADLWAEKKHADEVTARSAAAQKALEAADANYTGLSILDATIGFQETERDAERAKINMESLQKAFADASRVSAESEAM